MKSKNERILITGIILLTIITIGAITTYQNNYRKTQNTITISTTTSLYDTGLLEEKIGPAFQEKTEIETRFIPKGTGDAIEDARQGASDLILVHAKEPERKFLEDGHGVNRKIIAYNFFTIVGPSDDPAGIEGMKPAEALEKIYFKADNENIIWASRDDKSGTNVKEIGLWESAGYSYEENVKDENWFRSTGTGMGKTLMVSDTLEAYTLADMGTYLSYTKENHIDLEVHVDEGKELTNVYAAIPINPKTHNKDFEKALKFTNWLTSENTQELIGNYGKEEFGRQLFHPAVKVLEEKDPENVYNWIVEYGFIEGTECPEKYRYLNFYDNR